jgi:chromate transport protein ChrA
VVDFSVVTVVVVSMFELFVVDFSETGVCGELCGAVDVVIFSVVCSVVIGASQSIRKTCEWSLVISEILSCVVYKLYIVNPNSI